MTYTVYAITDTQSQYIYIGSTKNYIKRRQVHRRQIRNGNHRNPGFRSLSKHMTADDFEFEVLEEHTTQAAAIAAEQRWVDHYRADAMWQLLNKAVERVDTVQLGVCITWADGTVTEFKSAKAAAAHVGVTPGHLCNWMAGRRGGYTRYGIVSIEHV